MTVNMIAARFAGRPLAIAPRALEPLLAAKPLLETTSAASVRMEASGNAPPGYVLADGGIAVVPIIGPLLSRGDWSVFVTRPLSAGLLAAAALLLIIVLLPAVKNKREEAFVED